MSSAMPAQTNAAYTDSLDAPSSGPKFIVTPVSQTQPGAGLLATYRIALVGGVTANQQLYFDLTDTNPNGSSLTYPYGSNPAVINNGNNYVDFQCSAQTVQTYGATFTITVTPRIAALGAAQNATLTIGYQFSLTPGSQSVAAGVQAALVIALANGALAPASGFPFGLATSGAGGVFAEGASATIAAGTNSVTIHYSNATGETDTITVTPPNGVGVQPGAKTAQVTITAPPPPVAVPFHVTPIEQGSTPGVLSSVYVISLDNNALAPVNGYPFALSEGSGAVTFAPGTVVTIPAGQNSVSFQAEAAASGTYSLVVTPPASMNTAAQDVNLIVSAAQAPANDYSISVPANAQSGVPAACKILLPANEFAPSGGFSFPVASSAASGAAFSSNPVLMPAGYSQVDFTYTGTLTETDTLTVQPDASMTGHAPETAQIQITAPPPPVITYSVLPVTQSAPAGVESGYYAIILDNDAVAPDSDFVFALAADQGASTDPPGRLAISAGESSALFTAIGNDTTSPANIVVTPPQGVSGDPQTVQLVVTAAPAPPAPPAPPFVLSGPSGDNEPDYRLYSASGKRLYLPPGCVVSCTFSTNERGGYESGEMRLNVDYGTLALVGNEFIDVWIWNQRVFRGYPKQIDNTTDSPESITLRLYGRMQTLDGYIIRRNWNFSIAGLDAHDFIYNIVNTYVRTPGRLPGLFLDISTVAALNLTLRKFDGNNKTVKQAFDSICDAFPDELIWGFEVDENTGADLLYFRARAQTPGTIYAVGDKVTSFLYPLNIMRVVNWIQITGGALADSLDAPPANLLPNASFDESTALTETSANILVNPSFEDGLVDPWKGQGCVIAQGFGRTGQNGVELNNDHATHEGVWQDVPVAGNIQSVFLSCYLNSVANLIYTVSLGIELYRNGKRVYADNQDANPTPGPVDPVGKTYHRFAFQSNIPQNIVYDTLRARYYLYNENHNGNAGQCILDDCAMWTLFPGQVEGPAKSWRVSAGNKGGFTSVYWQSADITAYNGDTCVKAIAQVQPGKVQANYAEIATTQDARVQGQTRREYCLVFRVYTPGNSVYVAAGARIYESGVLKATRIGPYAFVGNDWQAVVCAFQSGDHCDAIEPFIRVYSSGTVYIDAAGMYLDTLVPPSTYTPDGTYRAIFAADNFDANTIGEAQAQSQDIFGLVQKSVSNDDITDDATARAFAIDYFKQNAAPAIEGQITITDASGPLGYDHQVRVVNLDDAPPALNVARVRYTIQESVQIQADLNNERPSLDLLLRQLQQQKI